MKEYILIILLIAYTIITLKNKEGYTNIETKSNIRMNDKIIDKFYAEIYDEIYNKNTNIKLCKTIINDLNKNSDVLCIGCKNGNILELLSNTKIKGLEKYTAFKKDNVVIGNYNNINLFEEETFTHIIVPLYVIHLLDDIPYFFMIIYKWLQVGGRIYISYVQEWKKYDILLNHEPSQYFKMLYDYTVAIDENIDDVMIKETIKTKVNKRINLWNYNKITSERLKHISRNKDFKFINEVALNECVNLLTLEKTNDYIFLS